MATNNFYWIDALSKVSEPIRVNRWLVKFNFNLLGLSPSSDEEEVFTYMIKEVDIPEFKNETDSFYYFGVERKLPTSAVNGGTVSMTIMEGENILGYRTLLKWLQQCANIEQFDASESDYNSPTYEKKQLINDRAVSIEVYSYVTGDRLMEVSFTNIKPVKVDNVKLSTESQELYKFGVSFEFDLATFKHSNDYRNA